MVDSSELTRSFIESRASEPTTSIQRRVAGHQVCSAIARRCFRLGKQRCCTPNARSTDHHPRIGSQLLGSMACSRAGDRAPTRRHGMGGCAGNCMTSDGGVFYLLKWGSWASAYIACRPTPLERSRVELPSHVYARNTPACRPPCPPSPRRCPGGSDRPRQHTSCHGRTSKSSTLESLINRAESSSSPKSFARQYVVYCERVTRRF